MAVEGENSQLGLGSADLAAQNLRCDCFPLLKHIASAQGGVIFVLFIWMGAVLAIVAHAGPFLSNVSIVCRESMIATV